MQQKILLVDDDLMQLKMLEVVFSSLDYELVLAHNGEQALQIAREIIPDIVLLDVMMPRKDGFEVCQQLRADSELAEVPIILITARADRKAFFKGMEAGADDFISKPFDPILLRARVQTITRLNRYRRLLQERAKLQWVVEQTKEGYVSLDEAGQIVFANLPARTMLNLPAGNEPILVSFLPAVKAKYQLHPEPYWEGWLERELGEESGYLVLPESATEPAKWLQVAFLPIPPRAGEHYFIRLQDVTSQMAEHQLVWSFHDAVSHKFQTPLAVLEGTLEMLADPRLPAEQSTLLLQTARDGVLRLQKEVDGVFQYLNAFEQGKKWMKLGLVPGIVAETGARLTDVEIDVVVNVAEELENAGIPISSADLERVIRELLHNARKFHPRHNPQIQITIQANKKQMQLQVADDGAGVPVEQLNRIWNPYYQIDKDFTGEMPGIGVGLSTIATMILNVGGKCRAFNHEENVGLIVEIELPVQIGTF